MPTPAELRKIFASAREVRLEDEQLRDLVEQVSGQRSTRALSHEQTHQLIELLVGLGARKGAGRRKPAGRRPVDGVVNMISTAQRELIADLRTQLGEDWHRDEYFRGACRKVIHKDAPLTARDGERVIEMLRARGAYNRSRVRAAEGA